MQLIMLPVTPVEQHASFIVAAMTYAKSLQYKIARLAAHIQRLMFTVSQLSASDAGNGMLLRKLLRRLSSQIIQRVD